MAGFWKLSSLQQLIRTLMACAFARVTFTTATLASLRAPWILEAPTLGSSAASIYEMRTVGVASVHPGMMK
jgi:hypothetical protein